MPGSFDLSYGTNFIAGYAAPVAVYKFANPGQASNYQLIPNVRCLGIDNREGPDPPTARFQYILDDTYAATLGWPSQFQDLWPLDAQGPYVVQNDDRVVVATQNPLGGPLVLFDGFAQIPQVDVSPTGQAVTFTAVNVAIRAFDIPVSGRTQRNSDILIRNTSGSSDIRTNLPTRFNPANHAIGNRGGFLPNCTPDNYDTNAPQGFSYPVFCDPLAPWATLPGGLAIPRLATTYWTVGKAIRYLLARYNPDQFWVQNPDFSTLDDALVDYSPADGFDVMSPRNPASYVKNPVMIRDYDATNKPWPRVVADLLAYAGFYMRWETITDLYGNPATGLVFYRRDEFSRSPDKPVYLGEDVSVADWPSNTTGIRLARDSSAVVNAFQVETSPRQVEISIIVLPLFQPTAGDEAPPACNQFIEANWTPNTDINIRRKYRWFGADELGEGHWGIAPGGVPAQSTTPCQFTDPDGNYQVFPPDDNGNPTFTKRYRPGHNTLISRDSSGRPLRATLQIILPQHKDTGNLIATDPFIMAPGAFDALDGDGLVAYDIPNGWDLLPDRLGIVVTADDPQNWMTGAPVGIGTAPVLDRIDAIGWWANPTKYTDGPTYGKTPLLILTVTIDDDLIPDVTANTRLVSPTRFNRWRVVDGRDHFKYTLGDPSSRYFAQMGGAGQDSVVVRNDTPAAQAHANQLRSKHEFPPTSGSITIPYITDYYEVGDQINIISGRNVNLQTNVGVPQGEAPIFPWVVGISWGFENDRQNTTLLLSDRRADVNNSY